MACASLGASCSADLRLSTPQAIDVLQTAHNQKWFVVDKSLYGFVSPLPAPEGPDDFWGAFLDQRGFAYIENEDGPLWFSDVSEASLALDSDGARFVKFRCGQGLPIKEFVSTHTEFTLSVPAPDISPTSLELVCAVFRQPAHGALVWFNIQSIWDALGLTLHPGSCASWVQKRKRAWGNLFTSLHLGPLALRLSIPWAVDAAGDADPARCLTWNGLSTHGALAAFTTCAWRDGKGNGGIVDRLQRYRIDNFVQALLRLCGDRWTIQLVVCETPNWVLGEGPCGTLPIALQVAGGMVDIQVLRDDIHEVFISDGVRDLCEGISSMSWQELFKRACVEQTMIGCWLYEQLLWNAGDRLDATLALWSSGQAGIEGDDTVADIALSARSIWGADGRHVAQELGRYVEGARKLMALSQFVSLAPDASKVGDRGLLVSPLVESRTGVAIWTAPQVG